MRSILLILALTGCITEDDSGSDGDTLGSGTLTSVSWGSGLCQRSFACAGSIRIGVSGFVAKIDDTEEVARGDLSAATREDLDHYVAAIKLSEPTGVFESDGGDGGRVEYAVQRGTELRIYYTAGFRGDFGIYVADLRTSIGHCETSVATYSSCTAQP
jgi:hypothetical protein